MSWWKEAVFYHIYPRSFNDSNDDGVGDLAGIISKMDYLQWLGVDAIWLSPIFPSPMADFGYDVSDFQGIDPLFGDMKTFDKLLAEAHRRGIKVVLDQICHNVSSRHPWFLESKESRTNSKADWFIWHDPGEEGGPPNNWLSFFSGKKPESAWEWVPERGQYYLHLFSKDQCDLNLRNPDVQRALELVLRFWLEKGVDGFRLDSVSVYFKDPSLHDYPKRSVPYEPSSFSALSQYYVDINLERPENLLALERIRAITDEYKPERVTVGESASEKGILAYLDISGPGRLNLAFNFEFLNTVGLDARANYEVLRRTEELFDTRAWPCYVYGHHDGSRFLSRILGEDMTQRKPVAKLMAAFLLTLRGTPFIYYGEELGMVNTPVPFDRLVDPFGKAIWPAPGRDVARTPMQWNNSQYCGFSEVEPWLPVNTGDLETNVAHEQQDRFSVLSFYRSMLGVRKQRPELRYGGVRLYEPVGQAMEYERYTDSSRLTVVLNFADRPQPVDRFGTTAVVIGTHRKTGERIAGDLLLQPYEAIVLSPVATEV